MTATSAPVPPAAPPAKAPSRAKRLLIRYAIYAVAAILVAIGIAVYKQVTGDVSTAGVGDCMFIEGTNADSAKVVSCSSSDAKYKVVGTFEGKTEAENNDTQPCSVYPDAQVQFWYGKQGQTGEILCLSPTS